MYVLIFVLSLFIIGISSLILDSFIKPKESKIIKKIEKKYPSYNDDFDLEIKEDLESSIWK
jgi:hypothetical protein